jgi:hypothetical protein
MHISCDQLCPMETLRFDVSGDRAIRDSIYTVKCG